MIEIRETTAFAGWLAKLKDARAKAKIAARIRRLAFGNPGDVEQVGEGISKMRVHHGPGYRVCFVQRGAALVVLLCGGDKGSHARDLEAAKQLARTLDER